MKTTPKNKDHYEALELEIVKEATNNGISFEQAVLIANEK